MKYAHDEGDARRGSRRFQQENFSEYHLYTLGRRTSIEDQETKQISLLQGSAVPVEKIFIVNGQNFYYHNYQNPGIADQRSGDGLLQIQNEEKSGLGMPLPAGNVRVYQKDSKGGVLFVGEDRIDHTPKDEDISIHIGNAFDVVSERKQTDFKKIATNVYEMEFEITLRNHKDSADHRPVQRTHRRHLGNPLLHLQIHQNRRLGRPIQRPRRHQRHLRPQIPRPRHLLILNSTDRVVGCRTLAFFRVRFFATSPRSRPRASSAQVQHCSPNCPDLQRGTLPLRAAPMHSQESALLKPPDTDPLPTIRINLLAATRILNRYSNAAIPLQYNNRPGFSYREKRLTYRTSPKMVRNCALPPTRP